MDYPKLRTLLLFPAHVSPNPTTLPLLTALQSLLNISYTATYCKRPHIFGTSHLRLVDPTQFADIIGADGFTIVIFIVKNDQRQHTTESSRDDSVDPDEDDQLVEMVATGSVKAIDDEDVRRRGQQRVSCAERTAQARVGRENDLDSNSNSASTASKELDQKLQALYHERLNPPLVHELRAFAVSPTHQGLGLGARLLNTIEWLLGSDGVEALNFAGGADVPLFLGARLSSSSKNQKGGQVHGVDLHEVRNAFDQIRSTGVSTGLEVKRSGKDATNGLETPSSSPWERRKLVLSAVRELGNEEYYLRRGYKSLKSGILPSGTWGSVAECTLVHMEKTLE